MGNYNQYTKGQFERVLKDLMKTMPLDKITVKKLTSECGTTRQNFYYHFRDMYDLMNWIYTKDIDEAFAGPPDEPFITRLIRLYELIYENRSFYKKLFSMNGQNTLVEYIVEHDRSFQKKLIHDHNPAAVIDANIEFAIDFYTCAAVYMTRYWLLSHDRESPEEFSHKLYSSMPNALKEKLP